MPMKQLDFPDTVGPFTTAKAELSRAFNAFYQQNSWFPRPDPSNNENMMIGMDPYAAGMGAGEVVFGQLSPLHPITLDAETKKAANIPASATTFAWAYPMVLEAGQQRPTGAAEASFVELGGYVYFDDQRNIVGTNCIQPAPLGTLALMFGRPQPLPTSVADLLTRQGRFQEITLAFLAEKGATHFGWIRPGEFSEEIASPNGCFAYKFQDGSLKYFPVLSEPVFTEELLDETLEETEAWAVLRVVGSPDIEKLLIFDKSLTLAENLANSSNDLQSHDYSVVDICRDSGDGRVVTYEEWQQQGGNVEASTVANPWVFRLKHCK